MPLDTQPQAPAEAPMTMDSQLEQISSKLDELPKREPSVEERERAEYDMLSKVYDKAAADEPVDEEAEPEEAKAALDRGPDGKFKSKLPEGAKAEAAADEGEEAEEAQDEAPKTKLAPKAEEAKKPAVETPKHWSEKVRAEFAKLDPEAQRELAKEAIEARQHLSRYGRAVKEAEPVMRVLNESKALFEKHGLTFDQGIGSLLRVQAGLENPNTAKDTIFKLARQFNVDLSDTAEAEDQEWVDPNVARLNEHVQMLTDRLAQYERHAMEQTQAQQLEHKAAMVDQFFADKGDVPEPVLEEVFKRTRMYTLAFPEMPANERLAKAWDEVQALSPANRERIIQEEVERKAKAAQKARRASSLNVTSSDKPGGMSEYDRLSAEYDRLMSA